MYYNKMHISPGEKGMLDRGEGSRKARLRRRMTNFREEYCRVRKEIIEREYAHLNPMQRRAVMATEGPLLLLAGAGSGKTTVLIHRVANLLKYGRGSDSDEVPDWATEEDLAFLQAYLAHPAPEQEGRVRRLGAVEPAVPWSIIAITFTNKAAGELKDRLERMLGPSALDIWASTFHSACVRILRRDIDRLGFDKSFTIYDSADSQRVVKDIVKELGYDEKAFQPRPVLNYISNAKDAMVLPDQFAQEWVTPGDWRMERIAKIYREYVKRLRDANALDFDDIILHTVTLLQTCPDVLAYYQRKFRYVLIDEYQDTNNLQYLLASLLAGGRKNICVVGDDDQSIYRFRGANIENILSFESEYQNARMIRLEQNYRSTQNILDAANAVIRHNAGRKGKTLWTENGAGDKVELRTVYNESAEADFVADSIIRAHSAGREWKDNAVLYRMNAQSNQLERAFKYNAIPYKIIGGIRYFDRAEVKDMLAYLCVVNNPADDLRLRRIINVPARGIGARSIDLVASIAARQGVPMFQVLMEAEQHPELARAAGKLTEFAALIIGLQGKAEAMPLDEFYDEVCLDSGYLVMLEAKGDVESRTRAENVKELKSSILAYLENNPEQQGLSGFLDEVALYTDLDDQTDEDNSVLLMTMHSAKGLEFPAVYVVGMEESVFPGTRAQGEPEEMEEERRLCYVAMTRAKEHLTMTNARQRMLFGHTTANPPSRFLKEIPEENSVWTGKQEAARRGPWGAEQGGFVREADRGRSAAPSYGGGYAAGRAGGAGRSAASGRSGASSAARIVPLAELRSGDMVRHKAFGRGMVLSVQPMGNDALLEIAFDEVGTKRLMLNSAGQYMEKE